MAQIPDVQKLRTIRAATQLDIRDEQVEKTTSRLNQQLRSAAERGENKCWIELSCLLNHSVACDIAYKVAARFVERGFNVRVEEGRSFKIHASF